MVIQAFPPIESSDPDGLLAIGGDLEINSLLLAYRSGIFPWPIEPRLLAWFCPDPRAVLYVTDFNYSRSLRRSLKRNPWQIYLNRDFAAVIEQCAKSKHRKGQRGTWITAGMRRAYCAMHQLGHAQCVSAYHEDRLVGGVYGVSIGGLFAGESMFFLEPDASKACLWALLQYLQRHAIHWIDTQVLNPFTQAMGAREVPRAQYLQMLEAALIQPKPPYPRELLLFKAQPAAP
jgi:leucyl/phenylalanyl-tRNA--protein transferase